jgi:hypothetical protein
MSFYVWPAFLRPSHVSAKASGIIVLCLSFVLAAMMPETSFAADVDKWCWYEICFYVPGNTSGVARPGKPSKMLTPQWQIKCTEDDAELSRMYVDPVEKISTTLSIQFEPFGIDFPGKPENWADVLLSVSQNRARKVIEFQTPTEEDIAPVDVSEYEIEVEPAYIRAISDNVVIVQSSNIDTRPHDRRISEEILIYSFDSNIIRVYSFACRHTGSDRGSRLCYTIMNLMVYQPTFRKGLKVYYDEWEQWNGEYSENKELRVAVRP